MPTPTYVAIAKTVLTGTTGTVTFSIIPQTYTDLLLVVSARDAGASANVTSMDIRFAGITSSVYTDTQLYAYNTTPASTRVTSQNTLLQGFVPRDSATANTFGSFELYIPNYTGSTNKLGSMTSVAEANSTTNIQWGISLDAGLMSNTTAVDSISIIFGTGAVSGSRFDLYGIKNS